MRPLSQIEIRNVDRQAIDEFGLPGVVLMENAGRGCADVVQKYWPRGRCVICCGPGNNGGDGFVIARHLQNSGWEVLVRLATSPGTVRGDAAVFLANVQKSGLSVRSILIGPGQDTAGISVTTWDEFQAELKSADLVIDAILGTGLSGEVRSPYREIIDAVNVSQREVFAVDLPSGMDCNTGKPLGACVRASRTATMVTMKLGFENAASQQFTGPIDIVDIGIPQAQRQKLEVATDSLFF